MNIKREIFQKIENGTFLITFCPRCEKYMWPLGNNCKECFTTTELKDIDNKGILLEKSYSHIVDQQGYFGIGDFSGVRIMGKLESNVEIEESILITKVKANNNNKLLVEFKKWNG